MTSIVLLPDNLWGQAATLGKWAVAMDGRDDQLAARDELAGALASGPVEAVETALGRMAQAWACDIHGRKIPLSKNIITRTASQLAEEVRAWLDEQRALIARVA